mmetsp:Transcript_15814/g.24605  ORF Transcript_15814/g.24605 Transcript_15814/m.24605 type:complete len:167 (-) Transcript_15814:104-604(-)
MVQDAHVEFPFQRTSTPLTEEEQGPRKRRGRPPKILKPGAESGETITPNSSRLSTPQLQGSKGAVLLSSADKDGVFKSLDKFVELCRLIVGAKVRVYFEDYGKGESCERNCLYGFGIFGGEVSSVHLSKLTAKRAKKDWWKQSIGLGSWVLVSKRGLVEARCRIRG